jgi:hypothetical protein
LDFDAAHPAANEEVEGELLNVINMAKGNVKWSENDGEKIMNWLREIYEPINQEPTTSEP